MISISYVTPFNVPKLWDDIKEGVEKCISKGGLGLHDPQVVYTNLTSGGWSLWLLTHKGSIQGFYILNIIADNYMEVVYGYIKNNGIDPMVYLELKELAFESFQDTAKAFKCRKILVYSSRAGMSGLLADHMGFDKVMKVYCKDLEVEDEATT